MPNREQRRNQENAKALGKWLHVEDVDGNPYDIYLKDVSGKDEWDYMLATQGQAGGLCDLFLKGEPTLVNVSGLIWTVRRKYEKRLTPQEVMKTVTMATIETMELHDPEEDGVEDLPMDDPNRQLAEMRANGQGPRDFSPSDVPTEPPSPDSAPSTA